MECRSGGRSARQPKMVLHKGNLASCLAPHGTAEICFLRLSIRIKTRSMLLSADSRLPRQLPRPCCPGPRVIQPFSPLGTKSRTRSLRSSRVPTTSEMWCLSFRSKAYRSTSKTQPTSSSTEQRLDLIYHSPGIGPGLYLETGRSKQPSLMDSEYLQRIHISFAAQ